MNRCEYYHCDDANEDCGNTLNGSALNESSPGALYIVWVEFSVVLLGINVSIISVWIIFIIFWYEGIINSNVPWRSFIVWLIGNWMVETFWSWIFCKIKYS